jgi:hypothetical protein
MRLTLELRAGESVAIRGLLGQQGVQEWNNGMLQVSISFFNRLGDAPTLSRSLEDDVSQTWSP